MGAPHGRNHTRYDIEREDGRVIRTDATEHWTQGSQQPDFLSNLEQTRVCFCELGSLTRKLLILLHSPGTSSYL